MNLPILIFIQLIFILFIGLIVYVSKKQRNFFLLYNFNLFVLCVSVLELFWFLWAYHNNVENACEFSKNMWC